MFPFLLILVLAKEAGTKIVSGDWDSKIEDIFEIPHEVNTFFRSDRISSVYIVNK